MPAAEWYLVVTVLSTGTVPYGRKMYIFGGRDGTLLFYDKDEQRSFDMVNTFSNQECGYIIRELRQ